MAQLATKRYRAACKSLLSDKKVRAVLETEFVAIIKKEAAILVSKSGFRQTSPQEFNIVTLYENITNLAPTLLACLKAAACPGKIQKRVIPRLVAATGVLLTSRNKRANAVQKVIGAFLFQGKAKHQVWHEINLP